ALNRAPGAWGAIAADGAVLDAAVSSLHALAASLAEQDVAPPRLEVVWELRDALEALRREDDLHSADGTSDAEAGDADVEDDEDERRDARRDADKRALLEEEEGGDHGDLVTDALTCLDGVEEAAAANEGRRWLDSRRSARRRFTEALRRPEVASRWNEVLAPSFWEALEQTLEDQTSMPAHVANGLAELPWSEGGSGGTHDSEVRVRSRLVDWLSQSRALWRRALRSLHEVDAPTRGALAATAVTSLAEAAEGDLGLLTDAVIQLSSADPVRALEMVDELTERGRITSDERQRLWGRAARSAERHGTVAVGARV